MRKANTVLSQISKVFHYRDRFTFKKLYIQYVRPHLEYAVPVWNPWLQRDIDLIEGVQKKAIRMISGLNSDSYHDRLKELNMETLFDRRIRADMVQVYKILNHKDNVDHKHWFRTIGDANIRSTRLADCSSNLIRVKVSKSDLRSNFFSQRVIAKWNDLPTQVKEAPTVNSFKQRYNNYVQDSGSEGQPEVDPPH